MKKNKLIFAIVWSIFFVLPLHAIDMTLEVRAAAFFHSSSKFRHLYGDVNPCYAIEVGIPVYCSWQGWANLDWVDRSKRHDCYSKSKVDIINGSFGAKYVHPFCDNWRVYLGGGLSLGGINLNNRTVSNKHHSSRFLVGGVIKSGVAYEFCNQVFVDAFIDYLYQPVKFHRTVDLGGVKMGLGVGYQF